jgi:subtilisin family serine protease
MGGFSVTSRFGRLGAAAAVGAVVLLATVPLASGADRAMQRIPGKASPAARYVPGEVLIGFRAQTSRAALARVHGRVPARVTQRFPGFRMELVKLARGVGVQAAIRRYERDPTVAFAEPNYLRHTNADALFSEEWDLNNTAQSHAVADADGDDTANPHAGTSDADIDAPEAWATEDGSTSHPVIAVIDTGVDVTQPDLDGQLWNNPGEFGGIGGVDDDGNGKTDDVHGWNFAGNDDTLLPPAFTDYEHGTHVAGTIAAELNGSGTNSGIVGVCPGCKIMVLRIATDTGDLPISAEIAALNYAKAEGAKIANMSLGGPDWSNAEREAIRLSGMLVVAAAGNDSLDNDMAIAAGGTASPSYPASYTLANVLAVAASNDEDRYAYSTECFEILGLRAPCAFTNWGHDSVDVAAPGTDITSTFPGSNWHTWDGTSMAAPHVAGVAGLVFSRHPADTVAQVKNRIMNSVDKPTNSSLHTMYISSIGTNGITTTGSFTRTSGRINADAALDASTANATPATDGNVTGSKLMTRGKVSGSVAWPADINDVRKRKLYKGHTYRITLVVPAGKDYDLYVWKPGTKEIWQSLSTSLARLRAYSAHGNGVDEVVKFKALTTGVYYIHVSAWLFSSGKYTLSIARLS